MPAQNPIGNTATAALSQLGRARNVPRRVRRVGRRVGRRVVGRVRYRGPALSVVVPVYNVREWIAPAMQSLLSQSLTDLEVVVVDDGSTDGSIDVVRSFADKDQRIRIVHQENRGLGAARNTGVLHATGEFLAFFDSDDLLMPGSYEAMVDQLRRSGSDFVTASFARGDVSRAVKPRWVSRLFATDRSGLTVAEEPWLLLDITAWNKVFRRSFWDRHGFRFVEGRRYEDQVPITSAFLKARAIDVLHRQVYVWRTRPDGSSITQQKATVGDLTDRLESQDGCASLVHDAPAHVKETWYLKLFDYDLPSYLVASFHAPPAYTTMLRERLAALREEIPDSIWPKVNFANRVLAWLLSHGELELATPLRAWLEQEPWGLPVAQEDGQLRFQLPFPVAEETLPTFLRRVNDVDVRPIARLVDTHWEDTVLVLRGSAFLTPLPRDWARHELEVHLVDDRGRRHPLPVSRYSDERLDDLGRRTYDDTSDTGFEVRIDGPALARAVRAGQHALQIELVHRQGPFELASGFTHVYHVGSGGSRRPRQCGGRMVRLAGNVDNGMVVLLHDTFAWTAGHRTVDGEEVQLELCGPVGDPVASAFLDPATRGETPLVLAQAGEGRVHVRLRPDAGRRLVTRHASGREVEVVWDEDHNAVGGPGGAFLMRGPAQTVVVDRPRPAVVVTGVLAEADGLHLTGRGIGAAGLRLLLRGERADGECCEPLPDGEFEVVVPLRQDGWGLGETVLPNGTYDLVADAGPEADPGSPEPLVVTSTDLRDSLPVHVDADDQHLTLGVAPAWQLRVDARALPRSESSPRHQSLLRRTRYAAARSGDRVPVVLFETFGGTVAGDSPAAIARELVGRETGLDLVFSVADHSVHIPSGTRAVRRLSAEWYDLLGSARYLVNNNNFPFFFEKAPGQVYLQTWHGTPLKRIAGDIEDKRNLTVSYLQTMDREGASWDYLISPNDYCSQIMPRAFRYAGPLLELGYPRNDDLVCDGADARRQDTRARLGVKDDQQLVLYAPTWRDGSRLEGGVYSKVLYLDPARVADALPDTVVLVRGHANTARSGSVGTGHDRVQDVTLYPDINDLFLASDVLVTDYSSVMFDYSVLDRPMLFLVPDLVDYRDRMRGFYFDFESSAPGPLLEDQAALVEHLREVSASAEEYAEARDAFRNRFAPRDDGRASARVVDAVFAADLR